MKGAFGLVSLLVVVGLMFYMFTKNTGTVMDKSKDARKDAAQFAGQDEDGVKARDSITLEAVHTGGGKFHGMSVKTLMPGGPMEKYYGLRVGDEIIQANQLDLKDYEDMAKALVEESYSRKTPIVVMREGQRVTLPIEGKPATPQSPANTNTPTPATPQQQPPAKDDRSTIQNQLEKIPGIKR
jgi:type II secretory pathway component PulC